MQRTLDRIPHFDLASRNFGIRETFVQAIPRSYTWQCNTWLDQGREGACVAFGWSHEAAARPVVIPNITNDTALALYHRIQQIDRDMGNNWSEGASVLAGAKAAVEHNWMKEYRWGFNIRDIILALGYKGPGVFGVDWYQGMFEPNEAGFIKPTGDLQGGHCILARGVRLVWLPSTTIHVRQSLGWFDALDLDASYVLLHNSWNTDWGLNGEAKISLRDVQTLMQAHGEFCIPVHREKGL